MSDECTLGQIATVDDPPSWAIDVNTDEKVYITQEFLNSHYDWTIVSQYTDFNGHDVYEIVPC